MTVGEDLDRKLLAAVDRLGRALRAARQRVATDHGLSPLGVNILEVLADGRPRRVGELAAELDITQPTVSDSLVTLEGRALVSRAPDPADRRSTLVGLTDAGADQARAIVAALAPLAGGEADPTGDRATTLRVLLGEIARLRHAGVITVDRSCLTCRHFQPPAGGAPAHCLLLDAPLADPDLRVDCPEHEPALASPPT